MIEKLFEMSREEAEIENLFISTQVLINFLYDLSTFLEYLANEKRL